MAFWDMASEEVSFLFGGLSDVRSWGAGVFSAGPVGRLSSPRCSGWKSRKASGGGMRVVSKSRVASWSPTRVWLGSLFWLSCSSFGSGMTLWTGTWLGSLLWLSCSSVGSGMTLVGSPGNWLFVWAVLFLRCWFLAMWILRGRL